MSKISSFDSVGTSSNNVFTGLPYLTLKKDKDWALVRIMHDSADSFFDSAYWTHQVEITANSGKKWFSTISCLRESNDAKEVCPLCCSQNELTRKVSSTALVKLLVYTTNEHGELVVTPMVWKRTAGFVKNTLIPLLNDYGADLPKYMFKITRSGNYIAGQSRPNDVSYSLVLQLPNKFNPENYPITQEAVDILNNYSACGVNSNILEKSYDEMQYYVENGNFPFKNSTSSNSSFTPVTVPEDFNDDELPFGGPNDPYKNQEPQITHADNNYMNDVNQVNNIPVAPEKVTTTATTAPVQPNINANRSTPWAAQASTVNRPVRRYQ